MSKELLRKLVLKAWTITVSAYAEECRRWLYIKKVARPPVDYKFLKNILNEAYGFYGIFWHEADLALYFSYNLLKVFFDSNVRLHIHTNYKLKPQNFRRDQTMYKKLKEAVKELRRVTGKRVQYSEVDIIVSDPLASYFEMCIELKYYHYSPRGLGLNPLKNLWTKCLILMKLIKAGVCRDAAILIVDDYLERNLPKEGLSVAHN